MPAIAEFHDIRDRVNRGWDNFDHLEPILDEIQQRATELGRRYPIPRQCDKKLERDRLREEARLAAMAQQAEEEALLAEVEKKGAAGAAAPAAAAAAEAGGSL